MIPLSANAQMRLIAVERIPGFARVTWELMNPQPGMDTQYVIDISGAKMGSVNSQAQMQNLMQTTLNETYRIPNVAFLETLIGQSIII